LQSIKVDIETLALEPIFQAKRMEALLTQLNQIQEQLETYEMTKDTELQFIVPKHIIKFHCIPASKTDTMDVRARILKFTRQCWKKIKPSK
jgi:hypothetical protein